MLGEPTEVFPILLWPSCQIPGPVRLLTKLCDVTRRGISMHQTATLLFRPPNNHLVPPLYTPLRVLSAWWVEVCLNRGYKGYPISDQIRLRGESENTPNYKESQLHQKACTHIHTTRTDSTPHHQHCCCACCSSRLVLLPP